MKLFAATILAAALATFAAGASLPGFRIERIGTPDGYLTSLAIDRNGTVYYTVQQGSIYRFANGASTRVAQVASSLAVSDAGLLGMTLLDDNTAAVHYTIPPPHDPEVVTDDVVSTVDLRTGVETILHKFVVDIEHPEVGYSRVHHGGNPVAAPDGSFFVGLGEYGGRMIAQLPGWNGGRIWRVNRDGTVVEYALGLRDPFDFVWDDARQLLIVPDNGDEGRDELHILRKGDNGGYPIASFDQPHPSWTVPPIYIWTPTISPVGTITMSGANPQLRSGIVVAGFVSEGLHYIPDIDVRPLPDPILVLDATPENEAWVDVAEAPDGTVYVASLIAIYRLVVPKRGDCNGDGLVTSLDVSALSSELADAPEARINAQNGSFAGSWGCDVNGDDRIDTADASLLAQMVRPRRRAVRSGP